MELDYSIMIRNIKNFIAKNNIKIGDLEKQAGVSPGYISRLIKTKSSKPNVPFIIGVADCLGVSVKSLLFTDFSNYSLEEEKLLPFLTKLDTDTIEYKIEWTREKTSQLQNVEWPAESNPNSPVLDINAVKKKHSEEKLTFGSFWYYFQIKEGIYFCLLSIEGIWELWMISGKGASEFVCSPDETPNLSIAITDLAHDVEKQKRVVISKNVLNAISDYMKDK